MVLIEGWQRRKDDEQRHDDQKHVLERGAGARLAKFAIHLSNAFLRNSQRNGREQRR
jgi:hypothetical protein